MNAFKNKLVIKGPSEDLDAIFNNLGFSPEQGRIIRHGDPSDVSLTEEQNAALLRGKPIFFGTTRVEIEINGDKEQLKQFILKRFPKVSVT